MLVLSVWAWKASNHHTKSELIPDSILDLTYISIFKKTVGNFYPREFELVLVVEHTLEYGLRCLPA